MTLDDWTTSEELFHYDLAVLCPPHFDVTFYLPRRALTGTSNRTFLLTLNDTAQRYHVFLTAVERSTHVKNEQRQLSGVGDGEEEVVEEVLLTASSVSFCCLFVLSLLMIVMTLHHHRLSRRRRRNSEQRCEDGGMSGRKVVVGVYALFKAIYCLAFTFSGTTLICRLLVEEAAGSNFLVGDGSFAEALTAPVRHRLAELEHLGGPSLLEGEDRQLRSSVSACSWHIDDLLSSMLLQTAQHHSLNRTSRALDQFRHVRKNFLDQVTDYVRSEKGRLDAEVAGRAADGVNRRLSGLVKSDWLRYPRSLFRSTTITPVKNNKTKLKNLSDNISSSPAQFAAFLEAGGQLNAIQWWTTVIHRR